MTDTAEYRREQDSMGEFQVPIKAYYGANTMRAVLNFPISDLRFSRSFIEAIATAALSMIRLTIISLTLSSTATGSADTAAIFQANCFSLGNILEEG